MDKAALQMKLLSDVALSFTKPGNFQDQIQQALEMIGRYSRVSRIYIFEDSPDKSYTSNTFEWCGPGINPEIENLREIPYEVVQSWADILQEDGRIYAEDVRELPEEVRAILEPQGILSIVVYPLIIQGSIIGFLGFDECSENRVWLTSELELLRTITGLISAVYERQRSYLELEKREKNFRSMFENIGDMIIIADRQGNLIYTNPATERHLGYTRQDFEAMDLIQLLPEGVRKNADEVLEQIQTGISISSRIIPLRCSDGREIQTDARIWHGMWDAKPCIISICTDITEQQAALSLFNKVFTFHPNSMVLSLADDKSFVEVNNAFERIHGYTRDEVIGRTNAEIGYFVDQEQANKASKELGRSKSVGNYLLQVRHKDGRILDGLFYGVQLTIGSKLYNLTVMIDITEQNRLRARIEEQKKRLEYIIASTRTGTWEWEVATGRVIINEQWANLLGYTLEELESPFSDEAWYAMVHPDDLQEVKILLEQHLAGETAYYDSEVRMKHKGGYWVWVSDQGQIFDYDDEGNPRWMFGTLTDISQRKKEEMQLLNSMEKALKGAEAKSIYLAQVSHEIRTPLNIILGLNSLLRRSGLSGEQEEYVRKMETASAELLATMTNILDFSRGKTGNITLEKHELRVSKVITECINKFADAAQGKGLALEFSIDPDLYQVLLGDFFHIELILQNLISNAVKFTHDGAITLSAEKVKDTEHTVTILFTVKDTGIGIPPQIAGLVFEPFYQADARFERQYQGSGLGLPVCRDLVRRMGGSVDVVSIPGEGSEFRVLLELDKPRSSAHALPSNNSAASAAEDARQSLAEAPDRTDKQAEIFQGSVETAAQSRLPAKEAAAFQEKLTRLEKSIQLGEPIAITEVLEDITAASEGEPQLNQLLTEIRGQIRSYNYDKALQLTARLRGITGSQLPQPGTSGSRF